MFRPTLCLLLLTGGAAGADENWPGFRGPGGRAVADDPATPDAWSATRNVVWKADVDGRGWSSPVVWGDRVFVTSFANDKAPDPKKGLYVDNLFGKTPAGETRCLLHCLDWKTGKTLWQRTVYKGGAKSSVHVKNSYASETPVTDGERVYAYFGNLGLFCYDMEGKKLWEKDLGTYKTKLGWGTGASPALHNGVLYVVHDNEEDSFLVALDARTGNELWKVGRDERSNWATPFVWENDRRTEIVTCGKGKVRSYGTDGKLLWELGGMSSIVIPTPTAARGLLYITSGYVGDFRRRPIFAIRPGASGDITPEKEGEGNEFVAWHHRLGGPYHPSPLVYEGRLYILLDKGFLSCYDARTGAVVYEKQRLPGDAFTASPWASGGKIFCLSEDGETFAVKAGPEFEVLGRNPLPGMALATPAVLRGNLLIRTDAGLYRIGQEE